MELLVYKASAGSGKTFTLAVEYIKHLIKNPYAYRQILAVTFTNKATAEMKERILQQLYGIWKKDPESEAYLEHLKKSISLPDEEIRQRAGKALLNMLHDYSRFRVETIDSFFQSVMRNLARELELSPNLNIELSGDEILSEAVDSMFEKLTPTSPVLAWLLSFIQERIDSDKSWNVSEEIKQFGKNIFDEGYVERGAKLRVKLREPNYIGLFKDTLKAMSEEALDQMKSFSDQFVGILEEHGLLPTDLRGGANGIGSYFRKLSRGALRDEDVMNATLKNCLESADYWTSKTSKNKEVILALAQEELMELLATAEAMRPEKNKTCLSAKLSLQNIYKLQLLNYIDEEVRHQNQEHNRFLLSDTNALLHRLVGEGDSSFVFEKLGANIQNVMIDEFQDTSRMQWNNFRLLLLEGLSQGADSLIVGDVKQSIYRWRNGDWSILNNLGKTDDPAKEDKYFNLNASLIRVETLTTNRRSEANIIEFNNAFFTQAVNYLNNKHLDELNEECTPLVEAYADVCQDSPKKTKEGYIKASFIEADKKENYVEETLQQLGMEVQHLLAEGVQQKDIAILVRKNTIIPTIADYFDKNLGLTIVSDEAFQLNSSQAVQLLISALTFLSNPANPIARYELLSAYASGTDSIDDLPKALVDGLDKLRLMPLYELIEELMDVLNIQRIPKQEAYLFSFLDAVTEYLQDHSSDLDSFLDFWHKKLNTKTIASGEIEGIRILSIHKSKGLEVHTVLIPFCDWKLENERNDQLVWCSPQESPYNALDIVPVNYSIQMASSVYRPDYLQERLQLWVDNLNILYVAFTRAKQNLIIWTRQGEDRTMAELLAASLPAVVSQGIGQWSDTMEVFESGELCTRSSASKQKPVDFNNKLKINPAKLPVKLENTRHEMTFRQSNRSADFIAGQDEASLSTNRFIERGRLLHTLFAAIRTDQDIEDALAKLVFEGVIESKEQEDEIRELTYKAFALPQVQDWYSGSWKLFNECEIIWMEQGKLQNKRPDRVMMRQHEVVVLDFKFGKPRKSYIRQVQEYMRLLERMGFQSAQIKGYLWYVDEERIDAVSNNQ